MRKYKNIIVTYALLVLYVLFNVFTMRMQAGYGLGMILLRLVLRVWFYAVTVLMLVQFARYKKENRNQVMKEVVIIDIPAVLMVGVLFTSGLFGGEVMSYFTSSEIYPVIEALGAMLIGVEVYRFRNK